MSEIQLSDLRTEFEYVKQDISDVEVAVFISWCNRVMNFVWRKLRANDPDLFLIDQTYSVTSDNQSSSLPSDFGKIDIDGCGIYLLDNDGSPTSTQLAKVAYGSQLQGYYLEGSNIVFINANNNSYSLSYIPKQPKFDSMSDYFTLDKLSTGTIIIDDEYMEYLVDAIDVKYCQWDDDVPSEGNADQRFVNVLSELLDEMPRDSLNLSIDTPYNNY